MKTNILKARGLLLLSTPIDFREFEAIGWFPYEQAGIYNDVHGARPPKSLYNDIIFKLYCNGISDNKLVVLFRTKGRSDTTNFAIFFHDCKAVVGSWDEVTGYAGAELKYVE